MKRRVAIYARVSTEHEAQLSALENQVQYYDDILAKHPDWILYDKYIDEGITGTSIKKRKNFMRMIEDAKAGRFDLIVTREVSRFARNTVDTLQQTRELKKIGVEVFFTEDNIWTFKDEDGELKLTIMATLAQNESKKTSQRVKAGQQISFQNGVLLGSGNILGYDKIDKNNMPINEEQAETVRYIYNEYLNGKGTTSIANDLDRRGVPTSTGMGRWSASYVARVLRNPFYAGIIVYRKQYVPDYLEQKVRTNHGEVEKIIVEGKHEPIISKEDFKKVQDIMDSHSRAVKNGIRATIGLPKNIWSKKLVCECGSNFNRKVYHKNQNSTTFCYICYNKKMHPKYRKYENGFKPCVIKDVQEWKLEVMGEAIFKSLIEDSDNREMLTKILLDEIKIDKKEDEKITKEINRINKVIEQETEKLDRLLDIYLEKLVEQEYYDMFYEKITNKIENYKLQKEELERKLERLEPYEVRKEEAKKSVRKLLDISYNGIDEKLIEEVVEKIIVHKDYFEWKLNFLSETIKLKIEGKNKSDFIITEVQ